MVLKQGDHVFGAFALPILAPEIFLFFGLSQNWL
jgi:hypothetical protein